MPTDLANDSIPAASLHRRSAVDLLCCLLSGYLLLILLCSLWLRAGGVMAAGQTLTYDRALFLSTSAATLTGFQQVIGPNDFEGAQGPLILIVLTVAGSLVMLITGGLAAARILRLAFTDLQVIVGALMFELLAVLAGTTALYSGHADLTDAVLQSACAVGNSGSVITAKSAGSLAPNRFPPINSWQTHFVLLPLVIVGGLGLPVVMELYNRLFGITRRLSTHSRTVLTLGAGVYIAATALLFISASLHGPPGAGNARSAFLAASTTAISARSAGLPYDVLNRFGNAGQWLIVLLMMIGASPAGTAGGVKATTFFHLFKGIRGVLRGRSVPRVFGIAAVWLGTYLVLAFFSFLALSATPTQLAPDQLAFVAVSALSNVGLSANPISMVGTSLFTMDLIMLIGRLAPLAILWWMAETTRDAEVLVA